MEWYWWVLIAVVVIAIAYIKLKVLGKMMEARKRKQAEEQAVLDK